MRYKELKIEIEANNKKFNIKESAGFHDIRGNISLYGELQKKEQKHMIEKFMIEKKIYSIKQNVNNFYEELEKVNKYNFNSLFKVYIINKQIDDKEYSILNYYLNFFKAREIYSFDSQNDFSKFYNVNRILKDTIKLQKEINEFNNLEYYMFEKGIFNVVFSGKSSAFVVHEVIGHLSEIDTRNLKWWKVGKKLFDSSFNVIDNPNLNGMVGSYPFDDEGIESKKKYLIKDGYINELLNSKYCNNLNELNGSARCESFKSFAKPRMSNTYLLEGKCSNKNLITGLNKYVYIQNIEKGGVDYKTEMVYLLGKGILCIENKKYSIGKVIIAEKLEKFIGNIQCIGKQIEFENSSWCIKDGQVIPVKYGSPPMRVNELNLFQLKRE